MGEGHAILMKGGCGRLIFFALLQKKENQATGLNVHPGLTDEGQRRVHTKWEWEQ